MTAKLFQTLTPAAAPAPHKSPPPAQPSDTIFYPETDGEPLPDGEMQAPLYQEIVTTLAAHFRDQPNTRVNGNTMMYYEEGNPRRHISPDCYVAFDVDVGLIEEHNTYRIWAIGKPPDFVLEIASVSTASNDVGGKRELYRSLGVGEYWRYDSTGGDFYGEPLVGEYLADGRYQRFELRRDLDGAIRGYSPALGLDLCWVDSRLRFYNPVTEVWLRNFTETVDLLETTEAAHQAAVARIAELEAELRRRNASG